MGTQLVGGGHRYRHDTSAGRRLRIGDPQAAAKAMRTVSASLGEVARPCQAALRVRATVVPGDWLELAALFAFRAIHSAI
jgi:hypothetical protein